MNAGASAVSRTVTASAAVWWLVAAVLAVLALIPLSAAWRLGTDLGHGWGAPFLAGYLYWERWRLRPAAEGTAPGWAWWAGMAGLVACAVPLRFLLTPYPLWPAAVAAYVLILTAVGLGGAWLWAGWAGVKWVGGPLLVIGGTLPWPGQLEQRLILPLREGMATVAAELSNLGGQPALAAGTSVRLGAGWVGIDEACGGIRSLQAAVMAALFLGEWLRLTAGRRIGLVVAGFAAAVAGNFLRVIFLVWRADAGEPALHAAHDAAGWLALAVTLGLTGAAAWRLQRGAASSVETRAEGESRRAPSRPALCWAGVAVAMLVAGELAARGWYARGEALSRVSVPQWRAQFPSHLGTFRPLPLAPEAAEMLRADGYEAGSWTGADRRPRSAYFVEWRRGQVARFIPFLHNPTVCLPMSGCELVRDSGEIAVRWEGREIPFHTYVFRAMNEEMAVAFTVWDPQRGEPLRRMDAGGAAWWAAQWADVRAARQHQPAQLLTLAIFGAGGAELLAAEAAALIAPAAHRP